jgi:hypothetical protein
MASRRRIVSEELEEDASGTYVTTPYHLQLMNSSQADVNMSLESEDGEELDVDIETSGGRRQTRTSKIADDDAEMEDEDDEDDEEPAGGVRSP